MAEPDKVLVNILGPIVTTAIGAAIGWLPGLAGIKPPALTALIAAAGAISGFVFSLMYKRYLGVLGAGGSRTGSPGRDAYNRLNPPAAS
jgi:membrane associated rhomboid family serine protease